MILISIYPEHVIAIKEGIKRYEFRKNPSRKTKNKLLKEKYIAVYETIPMSAITLILKIGNIFEDNILNLWEKFGNKSGISRDYFMGYYHGKTKGIAVEIIDFLVLEKPITLSQIRKVYPRFIPPQNFYRISEEKYPFLNNKLIKEIQKKNF